jgi:hypothetical protein
MRAGVCAIALSLVACAANRALSRDDLIARHTEAVGGARPIESVDRLAVDLRITESGSEVTGVWRADRQGRMRIDVYAGGRRVYTEAYDGRRAWQMNESGAVTPSSPEGAAALWHGTQYPGKLFGLHEMARHGHAVELEGREVLDGIDYYVLKLTLSDGFVTFRYVNPQTWLFDRERDVRAPHPDLDAKQKLLENRCSDYRPVAGVLHSFHEEQIDVSTGRVLQRTDVTRVEVNPDFPAGLFDPPG